MNTTPIEQIDACRWRLPRSGGMRVDGIVYADEALMRDIRDDQSLLYAPVETTQAAPL